MSVKRSSVAVQGGSGAGGRSRKNVQGHGKDDASTSFNGTRKGRTTQESISQGGEVSFTEEMLSAVRDAELAVKQKELDATYNIHDDCVRQLFHLKSFGNMLGYDPQEAKLDNTAVFNEFKEPYDLISKTVPTSRARRTRGAVSEGLSTAPISISTLSATPSVAKGKKRKVGSSIWDIIAEAHKAREQYEATMQQTDEVAGFTEGSEFIQSETDGRRTRCKGKEKSDANGIRPDHHVSPSKSGDIVEDVSHPPAVAESISVMINHRKRKPKEKEYSTCTETPKARKPARVVGDKVDTVHISPKKVVTFSPVQEKRKNESTVPSQPVHDVAIPAENLDAFSTQQPEIVEFVPPSQREIETPDIRHDSPSKELSSHSQIIADSTPSKGRSFQVTQSTHENGVPSSVPKKRFTEQPVALAINGARRSSRAISAIEPPHKKTRLDEPVPLITPKTPEPRASARLGRKTPSATAPPITQLPIPKPQIVTPKPAPVISAPSSGIKRVKLIVRRPPPTLSNPRQRPPPPKHKESLEAFLSSYISLNDKDVDAHYIAEESKKEASIREREYVFGNQGRFIPGTEALFGTEPPTEEYIPPKRVTVDIWDEIISAVAKVHKRRTKVSAAKPGASQVAKIVQAYWDKQDAAKDRARAQEEKRLRKLAEATMKLVTEEWKKVVFHIREKERLKLEEEERRRGHEHLDAILDQSGQILQTQQGDLRRSHSRSASASEHLLGWNSVGETDEEDGDDADEDEDEGEDADEDDNGDGASDAISEGEDEEKEDEGEDAVLAGDNVGLQDREHSEAATGTSMTDDEDGTANLLSFPGTAMVQDQLEQEDDVLPSDDSVLAVHQMVTNVEESPVQHRAIRDYPVREESESFTKLVVQDVQSNDDLEVRDEQKVVVQDALPVNEFEVATPRAGSSFGSSSHVSTPAVDVAMDVDMDDGSLRLRQAEVDDDAEISPENDHLLSSREALNETGGKTVDADSDDESDEEDEPEESSPIPAYLKPYAVAPVDFDSSDKIKPPLLLRGVLRPYQFSGLEWLASLHTRRHNGILADEMGLGKTIQTISLLAHLACDRGIWGPHLIIVPTSVILNWEMEFKKFLPGFKILSYHGSTTRRKELRKGWTDKYHFNVCITSYSLASRDAHIFKRKPWYYMILDEAHMIKNFKSQRWNLLLMFRSFRRLLLTGTPLQNNLTELWALLQFLMSGSNFANLKEFGEWFSNPLEKAIEAGNALDDDTMQRVNKLHTVLRPYLLRRLKRDVEKELPHKYEHLVLCPLSKRQRFLYDEFMARADTRNDLQSGVYQKIANILMQLRKVCNHPDLFEVRPIVTSFVMGRSAAADFEIKEFLIRKRFFEESDEHVNLEVLGLQFIDIQDTPLMTALETRRLDATSRLPYISEMPGEPPPKDTRTIAGWRTYSAYMERARKIAHWSHVGYLNKLRCDKVPIYSQECLRTVRGMTRKILPFSAVDTRYEYMTAVYRVNRCVQSYAERVEAMASSIDRFAFVTPVAVALDMPRIALSGFESTILSQSLDFDHVLHRASVKLQIAFPDPSLLQYDCGKLQNLAELLREKKAGGHRVLIFTQMTRILDILEIFLNFHGYLYLRLDGATKIEDRQYITERFNADSRVFCFISSSRSGGVGINLTGADTVVFYDSDFNPQMDRQCEDRAHRIGQIRDVHIYRFVSQHTVEEAMLRKANQKRSLDDLVIQKGEFDWRTLFNDEGALTKAMGEVEDTEDAIAAAAAAKEAFALQGIDEDDFGADATATGNAAAESNAIPAESASVIVGDAGATLEGEADAEEDEEEEEGGAVVDYMVTVVERDYDDYFKDWRL